MKKFKGILAAMLALAVVVALMPAVDAKAATTAAAYTVSSSSSGSWSDGIESFNLQSSDDNTYAIMVRNSSVNTITVNATVVDKNNNEIVKADPQDISSGNSTTIAGFSYSETKEAIESKGYTNIPDTIAVNLSASVSDSKVTITIMMNVEKPSSSSTSSAHTHTWKYGTIFDATEDTDGLEGYYCSCGANKETTIIPSITAIYKNRYTQMDQAGKGEVITLKMGEWNTYSKEFMQHLISATERGVTVKLDYKYEKKNYVTTVPAGTTMELAYDYYGPLFIQSLFETTQLN